MFQKFRKWFNQSQVRRTSLIVTGIFLIAFTATTSLLLISFTSEMKKRMISDKQQLVTEVTAGVETIFDGLTAPMITLSRNSSVRKLLRDEVTPYSPEWLRCIRDLNENLLNVNLFSSHILDIGIIKEDSSVVYTLTNVLDRSYDFRNAKWFLDALNQKETLKYAPPHGGDHFYDRYKNNPYIFSVIFPVEQNNRILGYILFEVDITRLSYIFQESTLGQQEGFLLVSNNGNTIFDYLNYEENTFRNSLISDYLQNHAGEAVTLSGNLYIGKQISSLDWYVLSETNEKVLLRPIQEYLMLIIWILIGTIAIIIILIGSMIKRMRTPMDNLIERIVSYDGTGAVVLNEQHADYGEIQLIRSKFEEMADKISLLIDDAITAEQQRKDIELEILIGQINPHFLYNVLQAIQTEAVLSNNLRIENMVNDLGGMLRYSMDRTREIVFLQDEIKHLKRFIQFHTTRFPELFTYQIQCPDTLLQTPMLKLSLQPIVENCFKHAFKNIKSGGHIKIDIHEDNGILCISISDNGCGINEKQLRSIRSDLTNIQKSTRIGLANIHTRIRLVYGNSYGLLLESKEEKGTKIDLCFPVNNMQVNTGMKLEELL